MSSVVADANPERGSVSLSAEAIALRNNRTERRFSLRALWGATKKVDPAKRGVSVAHLHRVEKGRAHLTVPQVHLIARALGISESKLFIEMLGGSAMQDQERLRDLENQNTRLKRMYAELALENAALKDRGLQMKRSR